MVRDTTHTTRDHLIEATCNLLEMQGYHATGMSQILKESGAPKGSLYYHFPDGKEELTAEAIERASRKVAERIVAGLATEADVPKAVTAFILNIAISVESSGFRMGGPLTTVAMETAVTNERINLACRAAYARLCDAFTDRLAGSGFSAQRAAELSSFIIAAIEGGIILSRTYHTADPLRRVAYELGEMLRTAAR